MPSSDQWRWRKHQAVGSAFAFVGGYADVISNRRWTAFCTMTTGNTIYMGQALSGVDVEKGVNCSVGFYLAIIASFCLGVVMHHSAASRWPGRAGTILGPILASIMTGCEVFMLFANPKWQSKWIVAIYAPLFGVVCAASADGRLGSATTMVTGHVISLGKALANVCARKTPTYVERCRLALSAQVVLFTVLGAFLGSSVARNFPHERVQGLFMPVPPLLALLLWLHDHLARPLTVVKILQTGHRRRRARAGRRSLDGSAVMDNSADGFDDEGADSDSDEAEGDVAGDVEAAWGRSRARPRTCSVASAAGKHRSPKLARACTM